MTNLKNVETPTPTVKSILDDLGIEYVNGNSMEPLQILTEDINGTYELLHDSVPMDLHEEFFGEDAWVIFTNKYDYLIDYCESKIKKLNQEIERYKGLKNGTIKTE